MLLGAIGILDNNADVLDAVMDDLRAVRGRDGLGKAERLKVDQLLSKIAQLQVAPYRVALSLFYPPLNRLTELFLRH